LNSELPAASKASSAPWRLALAYLALGLVWLGSEGTYHGDERFYTDAVLRMLASGDWLRPEYADGTARLNKPLLVYWLMGASMKLFGANLFAARLPFLVAGALLIPVTARLARGLFPSSPRAPWLATLIAASNTSLVTLAVRCTPDILLALSVAVAWIGLAELLASERPARRCAPWLWGGIGFAAASKGSLAIVLLVFALVAIGVARRSAWRELLHLPSLALGAVVAAVSLAPLWLIEDPNAGASFVKDQVSTRLANSPLDALKLAGAYVGSTARHFLPWVLAPLLAAFAARPALRESLRTQRRGLALAGLFAAALWVVFASANLHRGRYLSPAYPTLACAIAVLVLDTQHLRPIRIGLRAVKGAIAFVSALLALALVRVDLVASASCAFVALLAGWFVWRGAADRRAEQFALASGALLLLAAPGVRHAFRSDYWSRAAAAERVDATWGFDLSTPSVVRILSGGRLDPRAWPAAPGDDDFARATAVLAMGPGIAELERRGWRLEPCGFRAKRVKGGDLRALLTAAEPQAWFAAQGERVVLAHRP
jgi:4-amino-4-deoxy-L-arabinose transferase-like glycosyltransferase